MNQFDSTSLQENLNNATNQATSINVEKSAVTQTVVLKDQTFEVSQLNHLKSNTVGAKKIKEGKINIS
jgi:hypothetical protein